MIGAEDPLDGQRQDSGDLDPPPVDDWPYHYTDYQPASEYGPWKASEARDMSGPPLLHENGMYWEMDSHGNHRIVSSSGVGGEWSQYDSPCVSADGHHIAFTQYFCGVMPAERILRIETIGFGPEGHRDLRRWQRSHHLPFGASPTMGHVEKSTPTPASASTGQSSSQLEA